MRIFRSISTPVRDNPSYFERWESEDEGLITAWESGRALRERDLKGQNSTRNEEESLVIRALRGELVVLPFKGGVEQSLKVKKKKTGVLCYLAMMQGLLNQDLDIETTDRPERTCTKYGVTVRYTNDYSEYKNA